MGKLLPFGPGHPDYDNQLDLFEQVEPQLADLDQADLLQEVPASDGEMYPRDITCAIPCPVCVGQGPGLEDLQLAVYSPSRYRALPTGTGGNHSCSFCQGKSEVAARLRRTEGFWWDYETLRVIKAETSELAKRKLKCSSEPRPLYMEHGGYNAIRR